MNPDVLRSEYETIRPTAQRFCQALRQQIEDLLSANSLSLGVPLEHRVKSWESITQKVERRSLQPSSIRDIDDLVGLRLILLFQRDLIKARELIQSTFVVLSHEDTSQRLGEAQFGYQSVHFTIVLPKDWLLIPSFRDFGGLKAELQVRTIAQHIWAAASHELQYKQEAGVPIPVRRAINRVSALLETVDLEFERVLQNREAYLSSVDARNTDENLNVDLLAAILDGALPLSHKKEPESYGDLLADLQAFGIDSSGKLKDLIKKHLKAVLSKDQEIVEQLTSAKESDVAYRTTPDRLSRGVFFVHVGLVREMLLMEFGEKWATYNRNRADRKSKSKT